MGSYEVVPSELLPAESPRRGFGCHRALAVSATLACAAWLAVAASSSSWDWRGSQWHRLRANVEFPFREYDSGALGGLSMPEKSSQYDGVEDKREFNIDTNADMTHIFVLGDWGALQPNHQTAACNGWDCSAQIMVGNAMKNRAQWAHPQYVLNVGDAFYWGGIEVSCNAPPSAAWGTAKGAFASVWQGIYADLAGVPWISSLGNHDYGGRRMDEGWPQQIGYSFVNHNWILPARYYSRKVQHNGYVAEYFVIDSNVFDALDPNDNPAHNMCSQQFNPPGAQCTGNDGPSNIWSCKGWFWGSYKWQKKWMEKKVRESASRWKIVVTHFPCGYDGSWYKGMYEKYGLDLLVTGHRHQQELWWRGTTSRYIQDFMANNDMGGLPCIVSGGGGGITSENFANADYGRDLQLYGFFDLTMAKDWMNIELVGTDSIVKGNLSINPHEIRSPALFAPQAATPARLPAQTTPVPATQVDTHSARAYEGEPGSGAFGPARAQRTAYATTAHAPPPDSQSFDPIGPTSSTADYDSSATASQEVGAAPVAGVGASGDGVPESFDGGRYVEGASARHVPSAFVGAATSSPQGREGGSYAAGADTSRAQDAGAGSSSPVGGAGIYDSRGGAASVYETDPISPGGDAGIYESPGSAASAYETDPISPGRDAGIHESPGSATGAHETDPISPGGDASVYDSSGSAASASETDTVSPRMDDTSYSGPEPSPEGPARGVGSYGSTGSTVSAPEVDPVSPQSTGHEASDSPPPWDAPPARSVGTQRAAAPLEYQK